MGLAVRPWWQLLFAWLGSPNRGHIIETGTESYRCRHDSAIAKTRIRTRKQSRKLTPIDATQENPPMARDETYPQPLSSRQHSIPDQARSAGGSRFGRPQQVMDAQVGATLSGADTLGRDIAWLSLVGWSRGHASSNTNLAVRKQGRCSAASPSRRRVAPQRTEQCVCWRGRSQRFENCAWRELALSAR